MPAGELKGRRLAGVYNLSAARRPEIQKRKARDSVPRHRSLDFFADTVSATPVPDNNPRQLA